MGNKSRVIMHLDMDAFFASVEVADDASLAGRPVIVGRSARGVVSAASYEAREFGVHSAMPVALARRLCPAGVFLPGRMARYKEVSRQVMAVLSECAPVVEQASVDEAYLDMTGTENILGPPRLAARDIKARIREAVSLNCSVGVAPNRFLAKIASDMDKPDGLYVIGPGDVAAFMRGLPVGRIPGVGPKTLETLARYDVQKAGDILSRPLKFWKQVMGERGAVLFDRARGLDPTPVVPRGEPKSSSAENTFERDTRDKEVLKSWLLRQSERVGRDLRRQGKRGRTVTLKLKYSDFTGLTRNRSLDRPTQGTRTIYQTACALLDGLSLARDVRLIGVGVSNFEDGRTWLSLLPGGYFSGGAREESLDKVMDRVKDKFGESAMCRGMVLGASRRDEDRAKSREDENRPQDQEES